MSCKMPLEVFQTAASINENDRNWFGSSPDQFGKKYFKTTAIIRMVSELTTKMQGIPRTP